VFDESRVITIPSVNDEHLEFFETKSITFSIYAVQENTAAAASIVKLSTKEISAMGGMGSESMMKPSFSSRGRGGRRGSVLLTATSTSAAVTADGQMKAELNTVTKKYERLQKKEKRIQAICNEWQDRSSQMSEKEAESFYNSIRAVAFSSGITKLRNKVRLVNQLIKAQKLMREQEMLKAQQNGASGGGSSANGGKTNEPSKSCSVM